MPETAYTDRDDDRATTDPDVWRRAGRRLLAHMVGELAYEEMVLPRPEPERGPNAWILEADGGTSYAFTARRGGFGSWHVDAASLVRRTGSGEEPAWDPTRFVTDTQETVGLPGDSLAEVVRDLLATHAADARLTADALPAAELADLPYEDLEGYQTGHPCIFVNKGRLGFSAADAARYTPEARGAFHLVWIAVHPDLGRFQAMAGTDRATLLAGELDADQRAAFAERVRGRGGDPDAYLWLPVHPFQWDEVIAPLFASEIALGRVVRLGLSRDRYRPFQSIRTLMNLDRPDRLNVKVPLMIRNTLVWRGLSGTQTGCAPHTSTWLRALAERDPFFLETGVVMLAERASATVPHPVFDRMSQAPYRFHELLGTIWREPIHRHLAGGERARTMACLLLEGADGRALVAELVERSGLGAEEWLRRFLGALLPPVLHYLYRYGASFTPHGENVVLVFDADEAPVRIALKDFGSDVELLPFDLPEYAEIPEHVRAVLHRWKPEELAHSVLSAIGAGHLRFLADIVERQLGLPGARLWALAREQVLAYHARFPELADRFAWFDLLAPRVGRVALNREQLMGGGFHERAERDAEFDVMHGTVDNPLAVPGDRAGDRSEERTGAGDGR
ncbi:MULTISPECIES: IucA/IucC family siderophore biosynthesis protein [unclassified Nocardiopsis]|uniref:IucA/IucC family protein n=1 Tax=unclassified Nocardiopsis TaxID=2649073 RepID=UPI00135CE4AB|nr:MULTISPECIES: IucA/IucC family protein [unclassified Nocardiopsis]